MTMDCGIKLPENKKQMLLVIAGKFQKLEPENCNMVAMFAECMVLAQNNAVKKGTV